MKKEKMISACKIASSKISQVYALHPELEMYTKQLPFHIVIECIEEEYDRDAFEINIFKCINNLECLCNMELGDDKLKESLDIALANMKKVAKTMQPETYRRWKANKESDND